LNLFSARPFEVPGENQIGFLAVLVSI